MSNIFTVTMPDIGEGVMEGEVISWLKKINDSIQQDEPVVIIMTDKATVELPSPYPGRLAKQYYEVGQIAIKDKPLYDIELHTKIEAEAPHIQEPARPVPSKELKAAKKEKKLSKPELPSTSTKALASPPTRKLARELSIDINQVPGTGKEGRVTKEDLVKFHAGISQMAAPPKPQKGEPRVFSVTPPLRLPGDHERPLIGIPGLMARKMAESKENIPHFSFFEQLDATRLVKLRESFKSEAAKEGISVTYMPFIIRALSLTINQYPIMNSCVDLEKNSIIMHQQQNVGIAITTEQGLIVPVLKNVQALSMPDLIRAYEDLKKKALANKLLSSDMKEGTITVSNFGVLGGGGLWATPIINYPEVAILGIARIHKQPVIRNGEVVVRDVLNLSWSFDHRIIDGDLAATISHHFSTLLQNPAPLL